MPKRITSGRGGSRRPRGDDGPDLFAQQITKAVEQAFAGVGAAAGANETTAPIAPLESPTEDRLDPPPVESPAALPAQPETRLEEHPPPRVPVAHEPCEPPGSPVLLAPLAPFCGQPSDPLPARMLNEFVYCPRLFYYEHVVGVFVDNADTVKGSAVHARVDKGRGAMPKAKSATEAGESEEAKPTGESDESPKPEEIHSRSVMLGSDRLGVVAKMDLVEVTLDEDGGVAAVCPVDYKVGSPREGENGVELWDTDRMQLGLQCLVLRDNGYACHEGIIYYRGTKQRVPLKLTPELEAWVILKIAEARAVSAGPIPPPLIDSPKCVRCSLAPVCLPDETRMLSIPTVEILEPDECDEVQPEECGAGFQPADEELRQPDECGAGFQPAEGRQTPRNPDSSGPRRLIAPRDDKKPLYLNTQGSRVGCNGSVLKIKESRAPGKRESQRDAEESGDGENAGASAGHDRQVEKEVRVMNVSHVALFGNIQISTQAIQRLCDKDIPVTWFTMGGWFYGITRGHSLKNVLVRIEQFRHAADPVSCLRLAKQFVRGKIHNHRVNFMRTHTQPPESVKLRLGQARHDALAARSLEELLGVEGAAASVYFQHFNGFIRVRKDEDFLEGLEPPDPATTTPGPAFTFDFTTRNRRPPTDPVNALLSLAYSLLAKECTMAANAVGLDPYVGFYHQPRHGRPALALDVMEEFRPIIAESVVFTAINNRFVSTRDFVSAGRAVNLSVAGRKQFIQCFEQRMNSEIIHPVFNYRVCYRRALELQFRILARVLTGEIPEYVPFMTR